MGQDVKKREMNLARMEALFVLTINDVSGGENLHSVMQANLASSVPRATYGCQEGNFVNGSY